MNCWHTIAFEQLLGEIIKIELFQRLIFVFVLFIIFWFPAIIIHNFDVS